MAGRPDMQNVNNWHWVEKNATPWSRVQLEELLTNQTIEKGSLKILLKDFKKLEGEGTANNRKGKLIFLYDWIIEVNFVATVAGSELEYKGVLDIPNLSEENTADEIDVNITIETRGPHEAEIRHVLNSTGLEFVRKQADIYIKRLKEEFSKGLILNTTKPQVVVKEAKANFDKRSFQNNVVTGSSDAANQVQQHVDVTSFEVSDSFKVPPSRMYEILTNEQMVKAWASGNSSIDLKVGGKFTLFGGQINGEFVSLKENEEIVANWRLKDYPVGHFAQMHFLLSDEGDRTRLTIKAEKCPSVFADKTKEGLNRHYLSNIGRTFAISSTIF